MIQEPTAENPQNSPAHVEDMYQNWFLDYASYVILERAVPAGADGLKPVQRRILHAMKEMDDGRFNKVANVIGQTMQYHPHGDASIGDAMVGLGQKELLIETQGNWGDNRTGDPAAAARYIEARLSKFANEVAFNGKTTDWQLSYDGRKQEPITLPMKFPLLLAQGVEGIAVGLSTKILPHNFCELINASIQHLKGRKFELYPDFLTGASMDVSAYNDGLRGGKVRVRARIEKADPKTLLIKDVPYNVTTSQLVDSILKANDSGKIKIKSVTDNTAAEVELNIQLATGISADQTIDALYLFTDCEVSISPNACVIIDDKPRFTTISELLKASVQHTKDLLLLELQIKQTELENDWHYSSLEKIFIENRIYQRIEEETTWEGVLQAIDTGLDKFKKKLRRPVVEADLVRLTEIRIKRISKFDAFKADEHIKGVEATLEQVATDIANLTDYTIAYYNGLLKKYGKGRERKTELRSFETLNASQAVLANARLYVNYKEGFIGTGLKKDEFAFECSDLDQIIIFRKDGKMIVTKVADKTFVGKDIIYVAVFQKADERTTYNYIYTDGKTGMAFVKRFNVTGVTRDKEYDLTKGNSQSKVQYLSANANGEAEIVRIMLNPASKARQKEFDFSFADIEIKGRSSGGNQLTKYPVKAVKLKEKGRSTLDAPQVFFDIETGRLNRDGRGRLLGNFEAEDRIIAFYEDGTYELTDFEPTNRFPTEHLLHLEKFHPEKPVTSIYWDAAKEVHYAKRFLIESNQLRTRYNFVREGSGNSLKYVSTESEPVVILRSGKKKSEWTEQTLSLAETIDITGWKSVGTKIAAADLKEVVSAIEEGEVPTLF
ncbi:MAG: DNA gyrase/topoisomerase IV subunit A [Sphingobacteriales bacterium]|nr:MAG: DNA gyrase/topoisomerase IV subunit A [Sphingobacteriales bacterium]